MDGNGFIDYMNDLIELELMHERGESLELNKED